MTRGTKNESERENEKERESKRERERVYVSERARVVDVMIARIAREHGEEDRSEKIRRTARQIEREGERHQVECLLRAKIGRKRVYTRQRSSGARSRKSVLGSRANAKKDTKMDRRVA